MYKVITLFLWIGLLSSCSVSKGVHKDYELFSKEQTQAYTVQKKETVCVIGRDFLKKNEVGNWELFISGTPEQLGAKQGLLTQDLYAHQEAVFFSQIDSLIPQKNRQKWLLRFVKWYHRDITDYIRKEYRSEIFALSRQSSYTNDLMENAYQRALLLHGAHDIGHAMQNLMLVGCSSFAVWDSKTKDSTLYIGRNFDFYVGDAFAENKLIQFVKPDKGIPFASVSWPGMIGVVSGMNIEGLTVTMNAGKSSIPLKAKTPVSLVTREILQYASNLEEAVQIASQQKVFVSEALLIGSAKDRRAIVLEMSPKKITVYEPEEKDQLITTNHFQSESYKKDRRNQDHIKNSHSLYRYQKIAQRLNEETEVSEKEVAEILRDRSGWQHKPIGNGNEKALNQLLAHHAVIFKPEDRLMWVSSAPYQLGTFKAYDLNTIFSDSLDFTKDIAEKRFEIPPDDFQYTNEYADYQTFKQYDKKMDEVISAKQTVDNSFISNFIRLNPDYWLVYYKAAKYYYIHKQYDLAKEMFEAALSKEVTTQYDVQNIHKYLKKSEKNDTGN